MSKLRVSVFLLKTSWNEKSLRFRICYLLPNRV